MCIGAALEVEDIVGEIAADLKKQGGEQTGERPVETEESITPGERAAHDHARRGSRQRARTDR